LVNCIVKDNSSSGRGANLLGNCFIINTTGDFTTLLPPDNPPLPMPPSFASQPSFSAQSRQQGDVFSALTVSATGDAPITYQWFSNTTNSNTGGTAITGATGASFTPPSTTIGTRYYYVVATNAHGSATSNVSGAHTVGELSPVELTAINCTTGTPNSGTFGTPSWGGNTTISTFRTVGTQQWSDVVTVTNCNKTTWNSPSTAPYRTECRNSAGNTNFHGHYFSWCFVMRYAAQLCPSPWRVPTAADFAALHVALGYATGSANIIANTYMGTANSQVGGTWGGSRFTGMATLVTAEYSQYWSSSPSTAMAARSLSFDATYATPEDGVTGDNGFALRCVRD
jgi:uncharacterized protein (TIGR02145 family)